MSDYIEAKILNSNRISSTYPAAPVIIAFFPARRPLPFVLAIANGCLLESGSTVFKGCRATPLSDVEHALQRLTKSAVSSDPMLNLGCG